MDYISITEQNLEKEHICCAISNNNDIQVASKKSWLKERFAEGLVFLKSVQRGKCFIEYIPAENAWAPVIADGFMYINCFWIAGSLKGHGYANDLLSECIKDSKEKGKLGLCVLSSPKKRAFLSDPDFLLYKGFKVADESDVGINLMYLSFDEKAVAPRFTDKARHPKTDENGYVLYYTHQCPYNAKYVPIIEELARKHDVPFKALRIESKTQAKEAPAPCTSYALFYNGKFLTNEILSEKKFLKMIGCDEKE